MARSRAAGVFLAAVLCMVAGAVGHAHRAHAMSSAAVGGGALSLPVLGGDLAHGGPPGRSLAELVRSAAESHHHGGHHGGCGVGTPFAEAHFGADEHAVTDERIKYHTVEHPDVQAALQGPAHEARRRRLQFYATKNNDGVTFLPLDDADAAGLTAGIRIKVLWDVIESADFTGARVGSNALQCTQVGGAISVACEVPTSADCMQVWDGCSVDDIVGPEGVVSDPEGVVKLEIMKTRLAFATEYFRKAFKVKPVQVPIDLSESVTSRFNLPPTSVEDADLVVIMTARPSPWAALNGFASCQQRDMHGRCVVGAFNWVPKVLSIVNGAPAIGPDTVMAERHTALHELIHVLGGMNPNPTFIDETGVPVTSGVYIREEDSTEWYRKPIAKIVTPRVVDMARKHFNCPDMRGMPLEDQPTGRAAHWEARIMGPEVMSYGTGTGETYMSDLTFAHLEDTNQYIANYSYTGPLVQLTGDTGGKGKAPKIEIIPQPGWKPAVVYPVGQLRWGRNEGCEFVRQSAGLWNDRYRCHKNRDFGCSYDNKMSAVCLLTPTWALPEDATYTCGDCPEGQRTCDARCTLPNDQCAGGCKLPTMYQYFTAEQAPAALNVAGGVEAARTGGFSSAMDYAPVRLSYWNCQQANISTGSKLLEAEAGADPGVGGALGGAEDEMSLFGGQAYCPECRCFVSSLMDLSSGSVNPNFPQFGLCYRHNCFTENYLQFAIENQLGDGMTWYKCPPAGGKVYIAGFSGAFHCPAAEEFCKMETITGIKYTETDPLLEWIILSCIFGSPLLLMICCCFPCFRNRVVGKFRKYCGVDHFDRAGTLYMHSQALAEQDMVEPPEVPGRILIMTNGFIAFLAIAAFFVTMSGVASGRISVAAAFLLTMSLSTLMFSIMGMCAGCKESRGVSCFAVTYLYVVFFSSLFFLFSCMYAVSFPSAMGRIIERQWPKISETVPEGWLPATLAEGEGEELLSTYAAAAFVMAIVLGSILIAELWAIIKVVTIPVMAASMYTVINWVLLVSGLGFFGLAGYTARFAVGGDTSSLSKNVLMVVGFFVFMGVYFVVLSIVELVASHKKTVKWLSVSMCMSVVTMLLTLLGAIVMFQATRDVEDTVGRLTDDQIGEISSALGFTNGSREGVIESLRNNMRTMGMFGMCVIIMMCCLVAANWFFLEHVRRHYARARKAAAAYEDDDQGIAVGVVPHARGGGGGGGRGHRSGGRAGGRSKRPSRAQHSDFI
mmetsp:Transcript_24599/g.85546  ORF Transcript_24599/g.85546 Transcript_24599/m.85546 type:complete len:1232 (-) Transcript_24599:195-3890(-)